MNRRPVPADPRIEQFRALIKNRARNFHRGPLKQIRSLEDLEAIATAAVWQATLTYRDDQNAKFSTYVVHVVNHALIAEAVYAQRPKRRGFLLSLTEPEDDDVPEMVVQPIAKDPPAGEMMDAAAMRQTVREAVDTLPERLKEIVERRYWRDETLAEIGTLFGVTRERIRQLEAKAFDDLRPKLRHLWFGLEAA